MSGRLWKGYTASLFASSASRQVNNCWNKNESDAGKDADPAWLPGRRKIEKVSLPAGPLTKLMILCTLPVARLYTTSSKTPAYSGPWPHRSYCLSLSLCGGLSRLATAAENRAHPTRLLPPPQNEWANFCS